MKNSYSNIFTFNKKILNKTIKNLIMIEVQTGNYLEEDDIKRYDPQLCCPNVY